MRCFLAPLLLALSLVLSVSSAGAQEVAIPPFQSFVTDLTNSLSHQERAVLEENLRNFQQEKGSQIALLIVPNTGDLPVEQYALKVAEAWKLGRQGIDDGILFLIAKEQRRMRIEVGYGLEGAVPDITAKRIIADIVAPEFQKGNFFNGVQEGLNAIQAAVRGENLPAPNQDFSERNAEAGPLLFSGLAVGAFLRQIFGALPGALITGGALFLISSLILDQPIPLLIALAAFFLSLFGAVSVGGRSYSSGSSRSGGFSGGGGGRFGGGGASGGW